MASITVVIEQEPYKRWLWINIDKEFKDGINDSGNREIEVTKLVSARYE